MHTHTQRLETYSNRCVDVFGEYNALKFDHKKIDELHHVYYDALEGLLWNDVVLLRSQLSGHTLVQ